MGFGAKLPDCTMRGTSSRRSIRHPWSRTNASIGNICSTVVDRDLFYLEKVRYPFSNPYWYLGNLDPDMYLTRNYAPLDVRMKAYTKYARGIPKMASNIQANLKSPLPKTFVELGIAVFGGLADFYKKDVSPVFASVSDPDLQKQLNDANTAASQAMSNLRDYLISQRKTATDKFPLGKDLFAQLVKDTERVDLPIEQIEAAGRADLARNTEALKTECATYLPKGTLAACVAKMASKKPQGGPVEAARQQLVSLKEFVQKNNVVSIPNDDQALVAEAPPYNRSNAAFIQVPGSVRSRGRRDLQHRTARPQMDQGRAGGLHTG